MPIVHVHNLFIWGQHAAAQARHGAGRAVCGVHVCRHQAGVWRVCLLRLLRVGCTRDRPGLVRVVRLIRARANLLVTDCEVGTDMPTNVAHQARTGKLAVRNLAGRAGIAMDATRMYKIFSNAMCHVSLSAPFRVEGGIRGTLAVQCVFLCEEAVKCQTPRQIRSICSKPGMMCPQTQAYVTNSQPAAAHITQASTQHRVLRA